MLHVLCTKLTFFSCYMHVDECINQGGIFCQWGGFEKSRFVVVKRERERERWRDGDEDDES